MDCVKYSLALYIPGSLGKRDPALCSVGSGEIWFVIRLEVSKSVKFGFSIGKKAKVIYLSSKS